MMHLQNNTFPKEKGTLLNLIKTFIEEAICCEQTEKQKAHAGGGGWGIHTAIHFTPACCRRVGDMYVGWGVWCS
jgi:hypothetical protein